MDEVKITKEEKAVILAIARRNGCDRDGDIITFFVKEDHGVVICHPNLSN